MANDSNINATSTDPTQAPQMQPAQQTPAQQPTVPNSPSQPAPPSQIVSNPSAPAPAQPVTQPAPHPAVRHAGVVRQIAETLSGGPRFRTVINDDGSRALQRVPMDRRDIGMAIALSAITGALSGLQAKGPNATAQAAGMGFNATAQARKEADQQQDQQATQDFSRRAAVAEANMRMLNNAIQVGRLQREDHDSMVNSYADQLRDLKDNSPDVIKASGVSEAEAKDVQKYSLADYLRIPDGVVPRLGPDGSQVKINGVAQWDNTYTLIDKNAKTSLTDADGQPAKWVTDAISWGLPGYPPSLTKAPVGFQVSAAAAGRAQHQVVMLQTLQSELNSFTNSFGNDKRGKPVLNPIDLKAELQKDPSLLNAIQHFQRAAGASTQPDRQIDALRSDPKTAPYAARIITLFGADNLEKFKSGREARESAEKIGADTRARVAAENAGKAAQEAPEIEAIARSLAQGDLTSLKDVTSMRGDQRAKVYARVKQLNPNFNTSDVKIKVDTQEAFSKGKQGDQIQSFNTFLGHAGEAANANAEYRRLGSPLINRPLNWLAKNAENDGTYQTFITALQPVRDEYMTFLQNNHALTESDKKAGDKIMSDESTPAQIEGALKQMSKTAFIRLGSLNDRYRRVMGTDFPDLLNDDARNAANSLGLGHEAAKYQTGGKVTGSASGVVSGRTSQLAQKTLADVPAGKSPAYGKNGEVLGYADNKSGKNFVRF